MSLILVLSCGLYVDTLDDQRELSLSLPFVGFVSSAWLAERMLFLSYTIFFPKLYLFLFPLINALTHKMIILWRSCDNWKTVTKLNKEESKYWAVNTELAWLFPVAPLSRVFHGWAQIATVISLVPLHGPVCSGIHSPPDCMKPSLLSWFGS